eukprot:TRINITY_DN16947_c2_g3_i3.p1 TRINITY_DN16947_c2_g3~~TRINITY_DN16947_c2_g3_i3.p1  ORF type:complete len:258 (+),score=5.25 TRINITY_DN16947_c2_g3_i3:72-776(+)
MPEPPARGLQGLEAAGRTELTAQATISAGDVRSAIRLMLGHLDRLDIALQVHATRRRRFYLLALQSLPRMLSTPPGGNVVEPLSSQYPRTGSLMKRLRCTGEQTMGAAWRQLCERFNVDIPTWYIPLWWPTRSVCPVYNACRGKCPIGDKAHAQHCCLLCGGAHGVSHRHPVSKAWLCPEMAKIQSELRQLGWDVKDMGSLVVLWTEKELKTEAKVRRQRRRSGLLPPGYCTPG